MKNFYFTENKGFTLIELLIVIGIIGILATVAITAYVGVMLKADRSAAYANLESLRLLEEQFFAENNGYAPAGGGAIAYNATPGIADGGIEDALPGFQPGGCTVCAAPFGLNFTYAIISVDTNGDGMAETFTATATGFAGTRPGRMNDVFTIDQNNIKNF